MPKPAREHPELTWAWRRWTWAAYRQRLLHSDLPILVGPWRGEVGFEALYWIPFLDRLKAAGVKPERLIPITRGGAAAWYGSPRSVEVYSLRTAQEVRVENRRQYQQERQLKQVHCSPFDRAIIRDAARQLGLTRYLVLHPAWIYHLLMPFWEQTDGVVAIDRHVQYTPLPIPDLPAGLVLPPQGFVAIRFYHRPTWAPSHQTASLARAVIRTVAQEMPVVLMQPNLYLDDHDDLHLGPIPNVFPLEQMTSLTDANNLTVQSAVLGRCQAFVGTYGGFAQLALRLGKPSVSFYEGWKGTCFAHLALAHLISLQSGVPFHALGIRDVPMLQVLLPEAVMQPPQAQVNYTTAVPA